MDSINSRNHSLNLSDFAEIENDNKYLNLNSAGPHKNPEEEKIDYASFKNNIDLNSTSYSDRGLFSSVTDEDRNNKTSYTTPSNYELNLPPHLSTKMTFFEENDNVNESKLSLYNPYSLHHQTTKNNNCGERKNKNKEKKTCKKKNALNVIIRVFLIA